MFLNMFVPRPINSKYYKLHTHKCICLSAMLAFFVAVIYIYIYTHAKGTLAEKKVRVCTGKQKTAINSLFQAAGHAANPLCECFKLLL